MMMVKDAYGRQVAHCLKKCNCQRRKASALKFVRHVWRAVHRIWRLFMWLVVALRAFVVRVVFIGITIAIIWLVVYIKQQPLYWCLLFSLLPLLLDLHIATQAYLDPESFSGSMEKWFSLCIFTYLLCTCPSIWLLELQLAQQSNNATSLPSLPDKPEQASVRIKRSEERMNELVLGVPRKMWFSDPATPGPRFVRASEEPPNSVGESGVPLVGGFPVPPFGGVPVPGDLLSMPVRILTVEIPTLNQEALQLRIRIIEQFHLLAAIIGRWLLPLNGISSDQLSELLLINIGTAADILDLFEAFNEEAVIKNFPIQISILCLWQASLLQFCFNKTARLEVEHTQMPSNLNNGQHNAFQASAVEDTNKNFGMASPTKQKTHQSSHLDETEPQTEYSAQYNSFQASELEETNQKFGIVSPTKKETDESSRLNEMEAQTEYSGQHNAFQASALEDTNQNFGMASPTKKATLESSRLDETEPQTEYSESYEGGCCCCGGFWHRHERCRNVLFGTELWAIIMTLMLQDLPFMCLRLTLIFTFAVRSYQNIFFAIKNMILILAQVFRCWVLLRNYGPNYHMMDWSHIIFRIR